MSQLQNELNLTFGTATQVLVSTGPTTVPSFYGNNHSFFAYLDATTGFITGDGTTVTAVYNHILYDNGSNFNTGTYLFTAPVTGLYRFTAVVRSNSWNSNNTSMSLAFQVNSGSGATYTSSILNPYNYSDGYDHSLIPTIQDIIYLNSGDTVGVLFTVSGNGTKNIRIVGNNNDCFFAGSLIR